MRVLLFQWPDAAVYREYTRPTLAAPPLIAAPHTLRLAVLQRNFPLQDERLAVVHDLVLTPHRPRKHRQL